jgi:hypothetical protein
VAGREHELAHLLGFLYSQRVRNVVWITADVHYASACSRSTRSRGGRLVTLNDREGKEISRVDLAPQLD